MDAKYRVPTMQNRFGRYNLFSRNHFTIRGFSIRNGEWFLSLGQSG